MSENHKFDRYKIVLNGIISNVSPLLVGGGGDEETDSDILRDKNGKPFIPGASLAGILRHHLFKHYKEFESNDANDSGLTLLESYFGSANSDNGNISKIIFSDLVLVNDAHIQIRDGISIDNKTGITFSKAKFDYEVIEPCAEFKFKIEIGGDNRDELLGFISILEDDIREDKITIGAKTNLGFGRIALEDSSLSFYDLKDKCDIIKWIKKEDNPFVGNSLRQYKYQSDSFRMEFDFVIKNSLIIRHYSDDAAAPDSSHIKSSGHNVIPGTSMKGAIRARAERILNTLKTADGSELLLDCIFGNPSKPSRLKINEVVVVQNVVSDVQQRIKIDRFTGGTIEGALFDSMPIFAEDTKNTNKLIMELYKPIDTEIGLLLLILKDLWTGDLLIGGEKNIGRGVLEGKRVKISHKDFNVTIDDINSISESDKTKLQEYVYEFNSFVTNENDSSQKGAVNE
ncbi:RAMP superfamily CRISPR-associated protein [Candidatus Acidulodesulfobacterium sp. H_13]|uniref:RAMP superfamily CRISPR-associated protein n=1 Tax=Candidatus Acidulodesulfobacterium sp. H_13 TaxID=3395470 RepID=UPI003AF86EAE